MADYAELLDDVASKVANMARCVPAVEETEARELGRRVADMLAEDWGGSNIYIPKNLASRFRRRDAELYRGFTGHNVQELAQKYGLTQQRVYSIIKAERAGAPAPSFPFRGFPAYFPKALSKTPPFGRCRVAENQTEVFSC